MIYQGLAERLSAAPLPTSFRLFKRGWNDTENGKFLFDDAAAKAVMSAYRKWGVDVAIDLEHQMLSDDPSPDPTARDSRGWCQLQLRPDGSLWAVNVRWTPDGQRRLQNKTQRYVSPAFEIDPKTKRVLKIVNVAITSIPATHETPALIAASKGSKMHSYTSLSVSELKICHELGCDPKVYAKLKAQKNALPSGPASGDASKTLAAVAKVLGCAPDDADAMRNALSKLIAATGLDDSGASAPESKSQIGS